MRKGHGWIVGNHVAEVEGAFGVEMYAVVVGAVALVWVPVVHHVCLRYL